mmetsp:Transcript_62884/g.183896  ORF Transcript_62884/g.183896 Transcript_62884/m.183896 type:complete len:250 (-) Transcript_62884:36-785(-)
MSRGWPLRDGLTGTLLEPQQSGRLLPPSKRRSTRRTLGPLVPSRTRAGMPLAWPMRGDDGGAHVRKMSSRLREERPLRPVHKVQGPGLRPMGSAVGRVPHDLAAGRRDSHDPHDGLLEAEPDPLRDCEAVHQLRPDGRGRHGLDAVLRIVRHLRRPRLRGKLHTPPHVEGVLQPVCAQLLLLEGVPRHGALQGPAGPRPPLGAQLPGHRLRDVRPRLRGGQLAGLRAAQLADAGHDGHRQPLPHAVHGD